MSTLAAASFPGKWKFNPNVVCEHCTWLGHTKASYYRIIGFLPNFKFTKSKPVQNKMYPTSSRNFSVANNVVANHVQAPMDQTLTVLGNHVDNGELNFTPAQLLRLVAYLNKQGQGTVTQGTNTQSISAPVEETRCSNKLEDDLHFSNMAGGYIDENDWAM